MIFSLGIAALTAGPSCLASQPGDVLLTASYKNSKHPSFMALVRKTYASGGLPAFFVGTKARLLHVGAIITIQLAMYDFLVRLVS